MEKFNEKVATSNAQIYKMVMLEQIDDAISTYSELTTTPDKRVDRIKNWWLMEMLIKGFDTDNADISEGDSVVCINTKHTQDNVKASLAISWDELTNEEMELVKSQVKMFN